MTATIDMLLARWGRWAIRRNSSAIGYGKVSPMFRDCPTSGGYSPDFDPGFTPRDIIDCDGAVQALPLVHRVVVTAHYQRCSSLRATAAECGITHKTASQYLRQAHDAISRHIESGNTVSTCA